ncbi:TetR/AcrR family transcriptional regulator [Nocardioides stalactiti]|uniref:TetR/AcrR family transcriptional regulator n=1 Tax=Nocardioides stalactiti TaxID=2755356 RepID=UPI0015FED463|nr:TetR/AcrR family transcriptional regulator [Nocardioides stalactiti]
MRLLVTRDDYFEAAFRLLGTRGSGSLKIAVICKELKVTSGSFYGYFGSFDGFVEQFLTHWEQTQTDRIVRLSDQSPDAAGRIHLVKELTGQLHHEAEGAIRSWAHTNPRVAEAQKRVDDRRLDALTEILLPAAVSRGEAKKLAIMGMTLLIGLQQWRNPVTKKDFDLLFDEYEALLLDRLADEDVSQAN